MFIVVSHYLYKVIHAERRGFEPRIPFRGIHAFQACLFNHSSTSPYFPIKTDNGNIFSTKEIAA